MQLNATHLAKADPTLRVALQHARGDELLRAIVRLAIPRIDPASEPQPSQFPSRRAWREALIAAQQQHVTAGLQHPLAALAALRLRTRALQVGPTVIVEGPAESIRDALELQEIVTATLDRQVTLPDGDFRDHGARPPANGSALGLAQFGTW